MKKRRGYKFTNRKHSERAMMSTILGAIGLISMIIVLTGSYRSGGEVGTGFGFTGLFAMLYAFAGLVLGVLPLCEKILQAVLGAGDPVVSAHTGTDQRMSVRRGQSVGKEQHVQMI